MNPYVIPPDVEPGKTLPDYRRSRPRRRRLRIVVFRLVIRRRGEP